MDYIVWRITESEAELMESLQHPDYFAAKIEGLKPGSRRKLEVLAVRRALKELFYGEEQQVGYDEHGRPWLPAQPKLHVSISHTDGFAAVIVSEREVGIDIERRGKRVQRVVSHFLKPAEVASITLQAHQDEELLSLYLHLCWSAKEAAFKVLGPDYYDLQHLTTVQMISLPARQITLVAEGCSHPFVLHFDYNDEYVLVWMER